MEMERARRIRKIPVTSSSKTVSLSGSTSFKSLSNSFLVSWMFLRAVATTGRGVVLRRCRVRWKPIPRLAGVTRENGAIFTIRF